jgi:hypothetical protein
MIEDELVFKVVCAAVRPCNRSVMQISGAAR